MGITVTGSDKSGPTLEVTRNRDYSFVFTAASGDWPSGLSGTSASFYVRRIDGADWLSATTAPTMTANTATVALSASETNGLPYGHEQSVYELTATLSGKTYSLAKGYVNVSDRLDR